MLLGHCIEAFVCRITVYIPYGGPPTVLLLMNTRHYPGIVSIRSAINQNVIILYNETASCRKATRSPSYRNFRRHPFLYLHFLAKFKLHYIARYVGYIVVRMGRLRYR